VYVGVASGVYTNRYDAGTNLTTTIQVGTPMGTNQLFTLLTLTATNVTGPWQVSSNIPAQYFTNPIGSMYFKLSVGLSRF
jgi:hypothetical protein